MNTQPQEQHIDDLTVMITVTEEDTKSTENVYHGVSREALRHVLKVLENNRISDPGKINITGATM